MGKHKSWVAVAMAIALVAVCASVGYACTIVAVGKDGTVDGSTIAAHNDDSNVADFRLWIVPAADWMEGTEREIYIDGHSYDGGTLIGSIPEVPHTYRHFQSRYSFMNEKGVAIGESTMSYTKKTKEQKKIYNTMVRDSDGMIDCFAAQDIALERASTAREAVRIMGDLVEQYGWFGSGESMNVADGNELWLVEFYGRDVWAAVRIPDDHFFVVANRARIGEIDVEDTENYMASPNIKTFAIEQGWYDPNSGEPFLCWENYAPRVENVSSSRREWRALDLVAPSLNLDPDAERFPLSVKVEKKLSVEDVWTILSDYYAGTEYDLSKGPASGPWGNPLRYANKDSRGGSYERSINLHRTCYIHIGQTKSWLPDPIKGVSWFGYGAPDTTYLTPLWAAMDRLPKCYQIGSRHEEFRRDSAWWVNTYVQELATLRYQDAAEDIHEFRAPRMQALYNLVPVIQDAAAEMYATDADAAINMLSEFGYANSLAWHEDWQKLGDRLFGKYALGYTYMEKEYYPEWWNDVIEFHKAD